MRIVENHAKYLWFDIVRKRQHLSTVVASAALAIACNHIHRLAGHVCAVGKCACALNHDLSDKWRVFYRRGMRAVHPFADSRGVGGGHLTKRCGWWQGPPHT